MAGAKRYKGPLGKKPKSQLGAVRRERRARAVKNLISGTGMGLVSGAVLSMAVFKHDPSVLKELSAITGFFCAMGVGIFAMASPWTPRVERATERLGTLLHEESGHNKALKKFLSSHKYVFVSVGGKIVGTNRDDAPGLSRFRLNTKKILNGAYGEKVPFDELLDGWGPMD